ncbi:glycosyltransferase family 4 protein [Rhodobacter ferrooxidans]|uniref:Glycosyl transferase group 1 n=1 Tax=Rhodobacter ferrooxidans TaxID=371731 RepID=C8S376_9RHOB|nr:glycosyltransferase family 4 protein [Rhodobacter sp. SW2]EEW24558.1 glycosyl transferase group 1 [Rhodobacter sp. SW2]
MKILMILYGKSIGGAELQFLELARELAKRHQVKLISLGGSGALQDPLPGVEVKVYHYKRKVSALWGLFRAWAGNLNHDAKAIVTTSVFGNALGLSLNFSRNARLVSMQTVSKAIRFPELDRFVLRRFDVLVAGSRDIRDFLLGHGQDPARIEVVNNWVDFSSRKITLSSAEARQKFNFGADDVILGCIGRMHPQKAQEYLIRAFRILKPLNPELRLVLVGEGQTLERMQAEAADLGDAVVFAGTIVGDDYNNILNMFDIYVQPSRFEGLPRTLLDAMHMRKPIVATAVNGNLDAIRDGDNGFLVPAEDPQALAAAIQKLLNDPALASGLADQAYEDTIANFEMVKQLRRIEQLLS